jgi:hypothetical protein
MPVTKVQAMTEHLFHANHITRSNGTCNVWRRNGRTKTWKTRPGEFSVPVKYGLYDYGSINHLNADQFHTADNCTNPQNER